jgi:ubiquinone/menaquinone biosynthesis C-methylase UbiE
MKKSIPQGFDDPTRLPEDTEVAAQWQEANRTWWEDHPMRYDWKEAIGQEEFTKEFFDEIDSRFFENVRQFLPWKEIPFDSLIPFDRLKDMDVLEIGVGCGSHAQLLARHARSYTGIDLTDYAVRATTGRMRHRGIDNAVIRRMDAENLEFPDETFDFIWTWGVIHHSSDTRRILHQMHRVLKPGGTAVTMVYHRSLWAYYLVPGFFRGILGGDLLRTRSLAKTVQRHADGAIARYYTPAEWTALASECFTVKDVAVYGSKSEILPIPGGRFKDALLSAIPNRAGRFITNRCRQGTFLVSALHKS